MVCECSHLTSYSENAHDKAPRRLGIPLVPTLLGALAVLNVASVIMVLME